MTYRRLPSTDDDTPTSLYCPPPLSGNLPESFRCLRAVHTRRTCLTSEISNITILLLIMSPPLIGGGIKRCVCLTSDVCLSVAYIVPITRTERPRKTKIGREVAHVTRDSDTTFMIKRSKVKATRPLWLVVLAGQHGHTVMVTYPYAYMTYIVSPLAGLWGIVAGVRLQLVFAHTAKL